MKLIVGLMVTLMIASSIALPVNNPSDDVENVEVLYPEKNVEDIEPVYTSFLAPIPISPYSFFDGVEEYFRNIRQRLLSRFLDVADTLELDASKGNSTSEVKVINGHRVEVNNTVYVDKNEDGEELFKVRVLHIRPLDLDDSTTQSASGLNPDIDNDEKTVKPQAEGTTAEPEINNEIDQTKSPKTREVKIHSLMSDDLTAIDDNYDDDDNEQQQQTTNLPTMNSALKISKENIQPLYYETKNDDNQNHNSNSDEEIELYQLNDSQTLQPNNNDNDATKIHIEQIETTAADDTYTPTTIENVEIGISDIGNDNNINIKTDNNDVKKDNDNDENNDDDDDDDDDDDTITPDTDDDNNDDDDEDDDEKDEDDDNNDNNEDSIVVPDEETELDQTPTVDETNNNNIKDDIIDNDSNDDNDVIEKNIINRNRENFESSEETNDLHTSNNNHENFEDNGEWSTIHKDYNDDEDDNDNENIDENLNEKDNYNNEIDDYESIPIDLSNDINVNYIAKQNGITPDPDAEFFLPNDLNNFHVDNLDNDYYNIKNFKQYEKLTADAASIAAAAAEQTDIDNYESKYYLAGEHDNDDDDDNDDSNESERKIPIK